MCSLVKVKLYNFLMSVILYWIQFNVIQYHCPGAYCINILLERKYEVKSENSGKHNFTIDFYTDIDQDSHEKSCFSGLPRELYFPKGLYFPEMHSTEGKFCAEGKYNTVHFYLGQFPNMELMLLFLSPLLLTDLLYFAGNVRSVNTGWPRKNGTVDTVDFQDFALINSYFLHFVG